MRHHTVKTKDVRKFDQANDDLLNTEGIERMGILCGLPGTGKTTSLMLMANKYDAVFVRASACSTITTILGDLCESLGYVGKNGRRMQRRDDMYRYICQHLVEDAETGRALAPRPIFIDEADYCLRHLDVLDILRDIYDSTNCPTILIGMENIARTIQENGRFARRISQWIEFEGLDLEDTALVARELCEVEVMPDLIEYIHAETVGNIGRTKIGLDKIERWSRANRKDSVSLADWGERPLYYDQSLFAKESKRPGPKGTRK